MEDELGVRHRRIQGTRGLRIVDTGTLFLVDVARRVAHGGFGFGSDVDDRPIGLRLAVLGGHDAVEGADLVAHLRRGFRRERVFRHIESRIAADHERATRDEEREAHGDTQTANGARNRGDDSHTGVTTEALADGKVRITGRGDGDRGGVHVGFLLSEQPI